MTKLTSFQDPNVLGRQYDFGDYDSFNVFRFFALVNLSMYLQFILKTFESFNIYFFFNMKWVVANVTVIV